MRLTPKGGRDAIDGIEQTADGRSVLWVRVRAAPSEGHKRVGARLRRAMANDALLRLLARLLGVPPRAVSLVSGQTARMKRLKIDGAAIALVAALERICASGDDPSPSSS